MVDQDFNYLKKFLKLVRWKRNNSMRHTIQIIKVKIDTLTINFWKPL